MKRAGEEGVADELVGEHQPRVAPRARGRAARAVLDGGAQRRARATYDGERDGGDEEADRVVVEVGQRQARPR